jgi:hypothetical protein
LAAKNNLTLHSVAANLTTYLVMAGQDQEKEKKPKDKPKKDFHGAEMSTTAGVLAGICAIAGYLFLLSRRARQRVS